MAADIVPIRLRLTKGDVYTLWAPRWRADGDEWEAFLGKDEDLYVFESVASLAAFVRSSTDNDIADHPAWEDLTEANAHTIASMLGVMTLPDLDPPFETKLRCVLRRLRCRLRGALLRRVEPPAHIGQLGLWFHFPEGRGLSWQGAHAES